MKRFSLTIMGFYLLLIVLLAFKSSGQKKPNPAKITEDEVIRHNCDEPNDFANEKTISQKQRDYYDYLYENTPK